MKSARPELLGAAVAPSAARPLPERVQRATRVRARRSGRTLAVALHGIEPGREERCALIRDWLLDSGVERATLLVVPARDMHPVGHRAPALVDWLAERRRAGDEIAQHGLRNHGARAGATPLRALAGRATAQSEFSGLSLKETRSTLLSGWRVLKLAGIEPQGFVAPAYGYTRELRSALDSRYEWWADMRSVHPVAAGPVAAAPALGVSTANALARGISPLLLAATSRHSGRDVRLDVHVEDFTSPRMLRALERAIARLVGEREAVTYGEFARR